MLLFCTGSINPFYVFFSLWPNVFLISFMASLLFLLTAQHFATFINRGLIIIIIPEKVCITVNISFFLSFFHTLFHQMQSGQVDYGAKFDCHVNDSLCHFSSGWDGICKLLWTFAGNLSWHKDIVKQNKMLSSDCCSHHKHEFKGLSVN